jgi:hypothetical protein
MGNARTCWVLILGLSCATAAHAEAPAPAAKIPRDFALELSLSGHAGAQLNHYANDTGMLGGSALARTGLLEGGLQVSFASGWFGSTSVVSPALVAGLGWQTELGLRLDLLGILGADFYDAQRELFSTDPGTTTTLGFYGARAGVGWRFGPRYNSHVIAGVLASYERDFARVTRHYSYYDTNWFSGESTLVEGERTFGERRFTLGLYLALAFDLLPC